MRERLFIGLSLLLLVEGCTSSPQAMTSALSMPATPGVTGNLPPIGPGHPMPAYQTMTQYQPNLAPGGMLPSTVPPAVDSPNRVPPLNALASRPNSGSRLGTTPAFAANPALIDNALVNATMIESSSSKDRDNLLQVSGGKEVKRPVIIEKQGETYSDLLSTTNNSTSNAPARAPKEFKEPYAARDLLPRASLETGGTSNGPVLRMVNTKRFTLAFEMKDAQPGSGVEVWATQDQKTWKQIPSVAQSQSALSVEVPEDGVFGLVLCVKSAAVPAHAPKPGDLPQMWITVATSKPMVDLLGVELSLTSKSPGLVIRWCAHDRNFGPRPVTISYAENAAGPWLPLASGIANNGRHEIPMPANLPRKMYVRVEAIDVVGNIGMVQTPQPIRLELPHPSTVAAPPSRPLPLPVEPQRRLPSISVVDIVPGG